VSWKVLQDQCSDHLPIRFSWKANEAKPRRAAPKWCYKKARWLSFREEIERALEEHDEEGPATTAAAYARFKDLLMEAAAKHIPRGRRLEPKMWWNERADEFAAERRRLRDLARDDPAAREELNEATRRSVHEMKTMRANTWHEFASTLDPRTDSKRVFQVIRKIDGRGRQEHPGAPMKRGARLLKTDAAKADGFVKEYAAVAKLKVSKDEKKAMRPTLKTVKGTCGCCSGEDTSGVCSPFTPSELKRALNKLKVCKAAGADEVSNEMLKQLGDRGRQALLSICNMSWLRKEVPSDWRRATIIPILKAGKPPEKTSSYRPISLTSCVAKLMERLVQERLVYQLETKNVLNEDQAGFRALRSTEDQCIRISQAIADGFTAKKRTVMVLVDFKRAFDTVWQLGLMKKMLDLELPQCYARWTRQFLSDRYARVSYGVAKSGYKRFEEGLPQGAVLSPTLFLCFINDITKELPEGVGVSLFADDLALWTQDADIDVAEVLMQKALDALERWSLRWKLEISTEKTEAMLFTNASAEAGRRPSLELLNTELVYNPNPKFLGVTYDRTLTFSAHIEKIKCKMKSRTKVLQALRGRDWGCNKEDMRGLYVSYVRAAADYCAAAWAPSASATQMEKIEVAQNAALRVITGCTKTTPLDGLRIEAGVAPYADRAKELVATAYEKSLRLPFDNPRRRVAETEIKSRLQQGNWRDKASRIVAKTELHGRAREEFVATADEPPWRREEHATFNENLDRCVRKSDPPDVKRAAAEETITRLQGAAIDVYTDGSAVDATRCGGSGALVIDNHNLAEYELMAPAGALTCSYRAEMIAISIALQKIFELQQKGLIPNAGRINLYSDSKSSIQKLASGVSHDQATAKTITSLLQEISKAGNPDITLQWIPSHCGIPGNERADGIAKNATQLDQQAAPIDYSTAKASIKRHCAEDWHKRARPPFEGAKTVAAELESGLTMRERTVLSRVRAGGHTPHLAWYRNWITRRDPEPEPATCERCGEEDETVMHIMVDCPATMQKRQLCFAGLDPMKQLSDNPKAANRYLWDIGVYQ
jgi:ribonuclease HI